MLLTLPSNGSTSPPSPSLASEIIECERRLCAAQFASDVGQLDKLIDNDLIFVDLAGRLVTKAMDLEAHRTRLLKLTHSQVKEQQIRVLNAEAAVAITQLSLAGTYEEAEFSGDFRYTRVWQKTLTGWRIVAGHMSAVAS